MFYSYGEGNAFEKTNGVTLNINDSFIRSKRPITFICYSNKIKPEIQKIYNDLGVKENIKMKKLIEIFAQLQHLSTMDMLLNQEHMSGDIAAGHAILISAGGTVTDFDGNEILYGKKILKTQVLF